MVVLHNFHDVFDASIQETVLTLPTMKQNSLKIAYENNDTKEMVYKGTKPPLPFAASEIFSASICKWRRLTADHADCKPVYEVTFDITGSNFFFRPGDTVGIIPRSLDVEVADIIEHLDLALVADCCYSLTINSSQKGAKIPAHVPVKSTLRHVLKHCLDLRGIVKKLFLLALSKHTNNDNEKRILEYLCSKEGSVAYNTYLLNKNLCILDIFKIFKTCKPPVEVILEHLPRLLPRPYSIVNSGLGNPNEMSICFSVMNINNNRKGLVTSWLENMLNENNLEDMMKNISIKEKNESVSANKVPIYMRNNINQFSFPENSSEPMLLIGPGTGVAPYIGFLESRKENKNNQSMVWLFYGCRNPNLDFIYEEELQHFIDEGVLNKMSLAFSRLEKHEDKYVQDSILRDGDEVAKVLKDGALVYICGDVKTIAAQIKDCLVKCLVDYGDCTRDEAERFICDMQKERRYLVDSWN